MSKNAKQFVSFLKQNGVPSDYICVEKTQDGNDWVYFPALLFLKEGGTMNVNVLFDAHDKYVDVTIVVAEITKPTTALTIANNLNEMYRGVNFYISENHLQIRKTLMTSDGFNIEDLPVSIFATIKTSLEVLAELQTK